MRRLFALSFMVLGLLVAALPAAAAPPSGWQSEQVWNATTNDWEPAVAADPSSNFVYQVTTRYGGPKACQHCPDPALIVRSSSDGGTTWGPDRYLCACRGIKAQNDPQISVSTSGVVYAAWLNDFNPGVVFSKSSDHGVTWTTPIAVKGKGLSFGDKPFMAISPSGQDVYLAWNSSDSYMSVSHDGGATFAPRIKTNADSRYYFAEGGAIAPNGNVYFTESAENQNSTGTIQLWLIRSTDGGATWTQQLIDTSQQQPPCTVPSCPPDFFGAQMTVAVDAAGKILVAYTLNSSSGAPQDLYVRTSTDGTTWSARTEVGQNTGDAGFPTAEAGGAAGDFRLAWQDDRNGATSWNTWYMRSTDGGATWSAQIRLSNLGSGAAYKNANGYAFPYGDYFDIDVLPSGQNVVIWGEGNNYVGPGGTWFTKGL